ncbi:hypothetical protein BO70DRAFT_166492 [Aspergillus heteromorphus CBS 117.55]|uniref:Tim44-like domain-containing protein n=1 Tax=Aspergillus heteromorphus CBS 117.55 TaxID=1448321 RepID=A0A317V1G5_9EURO|nr:uncharacterized protein BO70DRAFT_166492 [Aspergillus heteromorphus CBS 117.55]PWY67499.1 hypothetical protein BO70DRAFT_166492 [Aspergillus heteromorphus CBS 117.55]
MAPSSSSLLSKGSVLSAIRLGNSTLALYPGSAIAPSQCRHFSQSTQRPAMRAMPQTLAMKQPAQPSMKTRGREISRADLPQDIGLLPGTFIRPLWRDLPSIFTHPQERMRMEWLSVKSGFQNFLGLLAYCKWLNKGLPLRLKERRQVARALHREMYSAYAEGNAPTIRKVCCTGLAMQLITRINNRPEDKQVVWKLDKYLRGPSTFFSGLRIVSDRATQIPELPNSGVRQVVVRITSRQSKGTVVSSAPLSDKDNLAVANNSKQQDCTEYIVIQKFRWTGEETEWRVWGHATPTTMEDLSNPFFAPGVSLAERMEAIKSGMGSK